MAEQSMWHGDEPAVPAVIGEQSPVDAPEAPEPITVYIPAQRFEPSASSVSFQLHEYEDDKNALLLYSSLNLLVTGCGEAQPWVAVRLDDTDNADELAPMAGADVVLWNAALPEDARLTTVGDDNSQNGDTDE